MSIVENLIIKPDELLTRFDPDNRRHDYYAQLHKESERLNLVSRETLATGLETLYLESLAPLLAIDPSTHLNYLDIGSGGGFPALPIALSSVVSETTMAERIQKKAAALTRMAIELDCKAQVIPESVEHIKFKKKFTLITIRLVRLDQILIKAVSRLLAPDGIFIYYATPAESLDLSSFELKSYRFNVSKKTAEKSATIFRMIKK